MGLQMTLPKDKNHMDTEFVDAYWAISSLSYGMEAVDFTLTCYPSREAKQLSGKPVSEPSIEGYGKCQPIYRPELYAWSPFFLISQVFPGGIPLGRDEQLRQLYIFIKEYTGLPFEDVFEEKEEAAEPIVEPVVEPEPEIPAEELYTEPVVDEPIPEVTEPDTVQTEEIEPHYFAESEETEGQSEEPEEVTEETETETEPEAEPEPEPEIYHNPLQL